MTRSRSHHVPRLEQVPLTVRERRRFRQLRRGICATDPRWFAVHCPRGHHRARVVRYSTAVLSFALVVAGALTGAVPLVLVGVVLTMVVATGWVGSRAV
jgi:hypothetical protein